MRTAQKSLKGIRMDLGRMRFSLKRLFGADSLKTAARRTRKISLKRILEGNPLKESKFLLKEYLLKDSCSNRVKQKMNLIVATGPYARVRKVLQLASLNRSRSKTGLIVLTSSTSED